MKVAIEANQNHIWLEEWINQQIDGKNVKDIKLTCGTDDNKKLTYSAMIMFND
ncbi:hypothetical protein [Candidatus Nitrosotenuis chungbukensis]|uniref:hypothetical protein n=1 Tax=Candidatus Nitrosotenuis chungbukensis TaxID=1353246 RepID=UPI0012FF56C9|nr:hypothetical protein [Candidatus Nitrosotenuis chungbukensis]